MKMLIIKLLYIDPGSGSLLFQALLSGLLTVLVFFKRIVSYIKFKFGKKIDNTSDTLDQINEKDA
jgi:hypothetical protein